MDALPAWLRFGALLLLVGSLSSCVVTSLVSMGYYGASGGLDHDAEVASAWRGPEGELALELEELEGVCRRQETVLVLTAAELEQMFAGKVSRAKHLLAVPHVKLPRAVLMRALPLAPPESGSDAWVPAAPWDAELVEVEGVEQYVPPPELADEPFTVHWTHRYRTGNSGETGFALLLTRSTPDGVQRALLLPEAFEPPGWVGLLVPLALAADVLWITLLLV
jgi:hypothetical protein